MSTSPAPATIDTLAEALAALAPEAPRTIPVLGLAAPPPDAVADRVKTFAGAVTEVTGVTLDGERLQSPNRLVVKGPTNARVVGFLASGAISVRTGIAPFEMVFDDDPGDDEIAARSTELLEQLRWRELLPDDHGLAFERAWRIKAAGGDAEGARTPPVLCRTVGAFRDHVNDLPILGRASMTIELTGKASLAGASMSLRHVRGDGGGERLAEAVVDRPADAAMAVVAIVTKAFGGRPPKDVQIAAESFELGYLSLGRRRRQTALAPFYVATVSFDHGPEQVATAHVLAVPASKRSPVRLPGARRPAVIKRPAA